MAHLTPGTRVRVSYETVVVDVGPGPDAVSVISPYYPRGHTTVPASAVEVLQDPIGTVRSGPNGETAVRADASDTDWFVVGTSYTWAVFSEVSTWPVVYTPTP